MTTEISLFDEAPVVAPPARARKKDPSTSQRSAARVVEFEGSHYDQIIDAMGRHREMGAEQIASFTGIDPYQVRKRLPELQKRNVVRVVLNADGTAKDRETVSGRYERLWELVK